MAALKSLLVLSYIVLSVQAQSTTATPSASACASTIAPRYAEPSVASGWRAEVVANNLTTPRGILFDSEGALLVVEQGRGISRVGLNQESGSCVRSSGKPELIIDDESVRSTMFH